MAVPFFVSVEILWESRVRSSASSIPKGLIALCCGSERGKSDSNLAGIVATIIAATARVWSKIGALGVAVVGAVALLD